MTMIMIMQCNNFHAKSFQDVVKRLYDNPKRIFGLPDQEDTYIEVDMDKQWVIPDETAHCRSKWTPFSGWKVKGCVKRVILRGEVVFIDGKVSYS